MREGILICPYKKLKTENKAHTVKMGVSERPYGKLGPVTGVVEATL